MGSGDPACIGLANHAPGRRVEKASRLTKEPRMESSVASPSEGQGVITLAGRRRRGVPPSQNTVVERRKASWSSQGRHVLLAGARSIPSCAFTALRSLFGSKTQLLRFCSGANRKENLTLARNSAARTMKLGCLKIWIWKRREMNAQQSPSSCAGIAVRRTASLRSPMTRASIPASAKRKMDGRVKPGHDDCVCGEQPVMRLQNENGRTFVRPSQIPLRFKFYDRAGRRSRRAAGG